MRKIFVILVIVFVAMEIQAKTFNVEKGVTTKSDILRWCGNPAFTKNIEGKECWFYETNDKSALKKYEKIYMYFQFSDAGTVEDNYETTENNIPYIKPKSLEQIFKEGKNYDRWVLNRQKYGPPDSEHNDIKNNKVCWSYIIGITPTQSEHLTKQESKIIEFDMEGNFIREYTKTDDIVGCKLSKEEAEELLKTLGDKYRNPEAVFNEKK